MFKARTFWFLALILLVAALPAASMAQQSNIIITVAVPELLKDVYESAIEEFETANPGIQVEIVTYNNFSPPMNPSPEIEDYLDSVAEYVSSADVLSVSNSSLQPEATIAGYFLDLSPLASSDPSLNIDDYYTALWQAFHWDSGIWALPAAGEMMTLFYNAEAFDAAGVPYPNEMWTMDDFANAIRALTQRDSSGSVTRPGFANAGSDIGALILSLIRDNVYDESTLPAMPDFSNPSLAAVLDTWADLVAEGVFETPAEFNFLDTPLLYGPSFLSQIAIGGPGGEVSTSVLTATLLPGGRAGVNANGYAVSSGTAYPEAAYALAKFLTNHPQVINSLFGSSPARRSLMGAEPGAVETGGVQLRFGGGLSPEMLALTETAFEVGISGSEGRFSEHLESVTAAMISDNIDVNTALQDKETELIARLDAAVARRETVHVTVAVPATPPPLAAGEIALNFGASSFVSPFPNAEAWAAAAQEFAAIDAEVGFVNLETLFVEPLQSMASQYDCFYMPNNGMQTADTSLLLNLSPLLASDPTFDRSDFVGNTLAEVTRDNQIYALPISVQPVAIRYNVNLFNTAGAALPVNGWTTSQFEDALRALSFVTGEDAPFQPQSFDNSMLLMLIAVYGGLPIDYRTNPVTINFTDPATVEAIRQVLDLAREGLITYNALAGDGRGLVITRRTDEEQTGPAVYTESISGFGLSGPGGGIAMIGGGSPPGNPQNQDALTTFPSGTQYNVVSYDISTAYISANTQYAEACYRFLSFLSQRSSLITSMPARRSLINNPELAAAQGENLVAYYQQLDTMMQQPNTVIFPTLSAAGVSDRFLLTYWLNRAFDRYVLEDGNLEAELAQAEQFTRDYQQCAATIPPFNPGTTTNPADVFQQLQDCARQADPTYGQ